MDISAFDLNLLVAFDALLSERSVTRAAHRLGLSQPAMSNALARLREGVGDPLFERTRHGIHPTPRALAMAEPVRSAMTSLHRALSPSGSEPIARTVQLAANMYAQSVVLPRLAQQISSAPNPVVLAVSDAAVHPPTDAALVIDWVNEARRTADERTALVLRDPLVCIVRRASRDVSARHTLDSLLEIGQVAVGPDRVHDPVDSALGRVEKRRKIVVQASDFIAAAAVVSRTDLMALVPRRLAALLSRSFGLRSFTPPLALADQALQISWPRRSTDDPLVMWIKSRILEAARELASAGA